MALASVIVVLIGELATLLLLAALCAGAGFEGGKLLVRRRSTWWLTAVVSFGSAGAGLAFGRWAIPVALVAWWLAAWQPVREGARTLVLALLLGAGPAALGSLLRGDDWLSWVAVLAVGVFGGESAAWLVGARWGRRRLAPRLSPNKTWEGAIAQVIWALLVGAVASRRLPLVDSLVLGPLAAGIAAQLGDLAESWCKRRAGVKDSGTAFGAQGGFFDLIDGLLGAAVVAALLL